MKSSTQIIKQLQSGCFKETLIIKLIVILFFVAVSAFYQSNAQTTVTVVDGATSTNRYGIIYEWRSGTGYSLYQHIYKQSLISQSGTIESIQFEHTANTGSNTNVKIYMGEVAKTSFSSTTDWINTGLTEVYSGTLTPASGWYPITLATPFPYSNTNSLVIAIHQNGGTTPDNSAYIHLYAAADANVTLYNYSSGTLGVYGSWSSTGFTRQAILPSLKLTFAPGCIAPALDAKADGADATTICAGDAVQLTANSSGGSNCSGVWEYAWYTGTGAGNTYYDGTTWNNAEGSANVYSSGYSTVSGVGPASTATYKVKARCSDDASCNNVDATGVQVTVISPPNFSNTDAQPTGSWDASLTKTILVCGLSNPLSYPSNVLNQVNIDLGDNTNSRALTSYVITLQSPLGTAITIKSNTGTLSSITRFNVKYRDHPVLQTPQFYGSTKDPFDIGYYRTNTAYDFSVFNGENPNGFWTVTITETSAANGIAFNKVDLIFGSAFVYNDISATNANDQCTGAQCIETGTIIIGTNNGYANPGPATDPSTTSSDWTPPCSWNGAKNNSAWFKFIASSTTAKFTISGLDNSTQILAFTMSGTCAVPTYSLVTGGCPTDAANDTYTSSQYANGCNCNMQLNMSSLTAGNTYYIVVDGVGGVVSDFYIVMESGAEASCIDLPIELFSFIVTGSNQKVIVKWSTASETNNHYFSIERSKNANFFEDIGTVMGAGNSNTTKDYFFYDEYPFTGVSYYRLHQIDYDGQNSYSDIRTVYIESNEIISIYPNPANEYIQYVVDSKDGGIIIAKVIDLLGREILRTEETIEKGITVRKISTAAFNNGSYLLQISTPNQKKTQKQFIIK